MKDEIDFNSYKIKRSREIYIDKNDKLSEAIISYITDNYHLTKLESFEILCCIEHSKEYKENYE